VRKLRVSLLLLGLVSAGMVTGSIASRPKDTTPPSYDMKAQSLVDVEGLDKQFVALADRTPADKFSWRPAPGVRSIAEVYLHVAGTNLEWAADLGTLPPPGALPSHYEQSTTDKAQVIDQLKRSFAYVQAAIEKMANADFAKPVKKYGPDASAGDIVYLIVSHTHEHLGQSIAYARMNGIVPPWTAAAQAKQQKQAQDSPHP
jgi:uncharacterized damage-inducible protein DinB